MKKIKALKSYVYVPYSLKRGETMIVPDAIAERLAGFGFVECGLVEDKISSETQKPLVNGRASARTKKHATQRAEASGRQK